MKLPFVRIVVSVAALFSLAGCMLERVDPKAKPANDIDPKYANFEYWFSQPAIERVDANDYDRLWNACETTATDAGFIIDRREYRTGLLTTKPLISKQFFEFWRGDVVDFHSQIDSDTTTHRRTAHFQIHKTEGGKYVCEVKVVVEHYAMTERRITAVYQYLDAFSVHRPYQEQTNDDGTPVKVDYWYAERRDEALEQALAARLRDYLSGKVSEFRFVADSR